MGSGAFLPAMTTRPAKDKTTSRLTLSGLAFRCLTKIGLWRLCFSRIVIVFRVLHPIGMDRDNESDEADRAISTGKLHALLRVHTRPINVVVFHGSDREHWF